MVRGQQLEFPIVSHPGTATTRVDALISSGPALSIDAARAVTAAAALAWWTSKATRLGASTREFPAPVSPMRVVSIPCDIQAIAEDLGRDLALFAVDDAIAQLGRVYTRMLPPDHRKRYGAFYTPPPFVRRLLDQAEREGADWSRCRVISPSCGAGAFLVEDAQRMLSAMSGADPSIIISSVGARLRGWDIDPFACWLSQLAVEAVLLPQVIASGRRLPTVTECRDSLLAKLDRHAEAYDLVNDNPAFGKLKDRPEIRERYARTLYGHPNTYGLFTDLALRLAKPAGGIVAYVMPTSWLGGEYFRNLRRVLSVEARPASVDIVESRKDVFDDVLQEVSLSCFVRGRSAAVAACSIAHVEPGGLRVEASGTFTLPDKLESPWILPRSADDLPVIQAMATMTARLKDWGYRISTGPLVWNRHKARLFSDRGPGRVVVIWAESVSQECRFDYRCDKATHRAYFQPRDPADPNLVRHPCLLVQRTTAKEQRRRLISGVMTRSFLSRVGGVVSIENHLNMLVPTTNRPAVSLSQLGAFFATRAADRAFRCINASVAVSASELEAMPVPNACDLLAALAALDPESAIGRLYGIDTANELSAASVGQWNTPTPAPDISGRHSIPGTHHQADYREISVLRAVRGSDRQRPRGRR